MFVQLVVKELHGVCKKKIKIKDYWLNTNILWKENSKQAVFDQ